MFSAMFQDFEPSVIHHLQFSTPTSPFFLAQSLRGQSPPTSGFCHQDLRRARSPPETSSLLGFDKSPGWGRMFFIVFPSKIGDLDKQNFDKSPGWGQNDALINGKSRIQLMEVR